MKLISLNIECNIHFETIFPFLEKEQPDVVCFQEVLEEDFHFLETKLGMTGYFKPNKYLSSLNPYYQDFYGKKEGMAIFSNKVINFNYFFYWGAEANVSMQFEEYIKNEEKKQNYLLLWVDVQDSTGETYKFATTHFPVTIEGESTPHQLEILEPFFKKIDSLDEVVFCGDFNAPRGNQTFSEIAKKYKDNIPLSYKTSIDQDLHRVKNIQFMVDGLFTTPLYIARDVKLVDGVSDHMAIVATITKNTH